MTIWHDTVNVHGKSYRCGFCGDSVGPNKGYSTDSGYKYIYICPSCNSPTYFNRTMNERFQTPAPLIGNEVSNISDKDIDSLYTEARACTGSNAFTAAVLSCRKVLMHIAVDKGAPKNKTFIEYVNYLSDHGYVPPDAKGWIDYIRTKGNEANHEIVLMKKEDALNLISFIEMLLKIIYEFPSRITTVKKSPKPKP